MYAGKGQDYNKFNLLLEYFLKRSRDLIMIPGTKGNHSQQVLSILCNQLITF